MPACGDAEKVGGSSAQGLRAQPGPRLMARGPQVAGFSGSIILYNGAAMPLGTPQSPHLTSCRCSVNGHLSTVSVWSLEAGSWGHSRRSLGGSQPCAGGVGPRAAEPMFTCGGFPQSSQQTSVTADLRPHAARRVLTFTPSLKRRTLLPGQANPAPLFHEH